MRLAIALGVATFLASCGPDPEPPPRPVVRKPAPPPAPPLEERMRALAEKVKAAPVKFRTLHDAWGDLLPDALGTKHETAIREKLESLEGRANLTYREFYRAVQGEVRRLTAQRRLYEAREQLLAWKIPREMDILGLLTAERAGELGMLDELIRLEELRADLEKSFNSADYAGAAELKDGRVTGVGISQGRLWTLDAGFREGWRGLPFAEIMGESQREFYGTLRSLQYAQAWSMVHFFCHGEGGRYSPAFEAYLTSVVRSAPRSRAFEESFGREDLPKMQDEWRAHVRGLIK